MALAKGAISNAELATATSPPIAGEPVEPAKIRAATPVFDDTLNTVRFEKDMDSVSSSESREDGDCSSKSERAAAAGAANTTAVSLVSAGANSNVGGDGDLSVDASDRNPAIQLSAGPATSVASPAPRSLAEKGKPSGVGTGSMISEKAVAAATAAAAVSFRNAVTNKKNNRVASLSIRARLHKLHLTSSMVVQQQDIPTKEGAAPSRSKKDGHIVATAHMSKAKENEVLHEGLALLRYKSAGYTAATLPLKSCLKLSSSHHLSYTSLLSGVKQRERTNGGARDGGGNDEDSLPMQHKVSFTSLEIRSYNVTLGNAPTPNGPPVSLAWEYDPAATEEHDVDAYELHRPSLRRSRGELLMPPEHRRHLLLQEGGCTIQEIQGAVKEARRAARQRERTARGTRWRFASCVA